MSNEAVYNRIAMLRAERKVSRRELADALGVHYQTVSYLERGEYSPSLYLALRIAAYFEVPVEVIFSTEAFPRLGSSSVQSASAGLGPAAEQRGVNGRGARGPRRDRAGPGGPR